MSRGDEGGAGEFLAEADEILDQLAADLTELEASAEQGDPDPETINSIFRGAHSLKGIAAMFGYAQITELSHQLESLLDGLRMGRVACDRAALDLLFEGLDRLQGLCGRLSEGQTPEDPGTEAFLERLAAAGDPAPSAEAPDPLAALGLDPGTRNVLTDYEVHRLEETLKSPKRTLVRVRAAFSLGTFDTDLQGLNDRLKRCGEIISTLPSAGPAEGDSLEFELLVGAKVGMDELRAAVEPFGACAEVLEGAGAAGACAPPRAPEPEGPPGEAAEAAGEDPSPEAPSQDRPAPGREAPGRAPAPSGGGELRSLTRTVRVDLPKLDALMNLVGELVLTKGRIQIIGRELRRRMGFTGEVVELTKAQKELERKLSELQQAVMDVRMVPLGQLFSKLNRVLRKIVHNSSKEVDLEIVGADTELDKLIVEDLSDPLIHVIRNAVDHGIEEPEVREGVGKPRTGTVRVAARQRGNHVLIEVADDGAGLCPERIREKAIEKGFIPPDARLDEKELFDLIFQPGFSTKEEVTELSGRGVGMDVLRKNIAALSGMIELRSRKGRGTTVTIVLPITLAIIQALLVAVGDQTYAIPLNSVLETLAVEPDMVKALEGHPVLRLREATMPLARVDGLFGMEDADGPPAYAVVVGVAEKRVAFGVDDLVSQQDVVIKSLGRRLAGLPGVAGATDLGDQNTVLVLDVAALVDEVYPGG
ncbi:MAG: chemotaxis protein CheA [Deferrisomatales bacterium]